MTMAIEANVVAVPPKLGGVWEWPPANKEKPMTGKRNISVRNRIRLARLEFAVTRWESAAMIALTVISTPGARLLAAIQLLPDAAWLAVLVFGIAAEVLLVLSSMADADAGIDFVGEALRRHFRVTGLVDILLHGHVLRAMEYRTRLESVLGGRRRASRGAMSGTVTQVDRWLDGICQLARRLDDFRDEVTFQAGDKTHLLNRIADLDGRAAGTANHKVKRQLRATVTGLRRQLRTIEELEGLIERGLLRLEHAIGALGTIYTQITILAARGMEADDAARLADEISEEVGQVDAVLAAMDRVYDAYAADAGPADDALQEPAR